MPSRRRPKKGDYSAVCPLCKRRRLTGLTLRWHLLNVHAYKPCKTCKEIFDSDASLQQHFCPMKNFHCDKCPKFFRSAVGWMLHHKKVHSGLRHVCHICGDQLSDVNSLRRHMACRHLAGRAGRVVPPCNICGKQMKSKDSLWNHERRVHLESYRSVPCQFCCRIFYSGFSLKRHLATVHRGCQQEDGSQGPVKEEKTAEGEREERGEEQEGTEIVV